MNIYIVTETIYNGDEDEVYQSNLQAFKNREDADKYINEIEKNNSKIIEQKENAVDVH